MLHRFYRRLPGQPGLEECHYIEVDGELNRKDTIVLRYLVDDNPDNVRRRPFRTKGVIEIGPRLSVETPVSSNAMAAGNRMGIPVRRYEMSTRYAPSAHGQIELDPLTQEKYPAPLASFDSGQKPEPVRFIPVLEEGEAALAAANKRLGLGMDAGDIAYYCDVFRRLGRNPTDVEIFQIANGNSEHSRHPFFNGILVIDGAEMPDSLMSLVKEPWKLRPGPSLSAFRDNSGVIRGHDAPIPVLRPLTPGGPSPLGYCLVTLDYTATAETHNHPTLIAPFPGAATGSGGRIRDNRAVGRGGLAHAGIAGYAVGGLHIPGYSIPGETVGGEETATHATPLRIVIEASNGISDYGNKIGEPLIGGFFRTFAQVVFGERREFRKPVLYTGGLGRVDRRHVEKGKPEPGMHIVRIGGPAYRIGVGGGSASSMMHGTNAAELDLKSVQRGDPEMENRVNRVIQACAELGDGNPIVSIHDQGAGGPSNVLTELMEPVGGRIDIRKIVVGDRTMSVLEIWVAEYQEGYGILVSPENLSVLQAICERERVNCEVLGEITGDKHVVVHDPFDGTTPVNLALDDLFAKVPRKRLLLDRVPRELVPLTLPDLPLAELLELVLRLPQVGSKGHFTRKIDRSVGGYVAQQPCVGMMQVPVANAGVTADSYADITGAATAIGEQPIKMLVNSAAGARMAVAEMLTNLASVRVSSLRDVTCRANWMWAAKLPGEGALLYDAAKALSEFLIELRSRIDGGKDSLSMATTVEETRVVSPGQLVIMGYAPVPDVRKSVTPELAGDGVLGLVELHAGPGRLGGSSLAQAFGQIGDDCPDVEDPRLLVRLFEAVQDLIEKDLITAYHDRSDGGLITAIVEMCLAGNCGADLRLLVGEDPVTTFFNEEVGAVFECGHDRWPDVMRVLHRYGLVPRMLGTTDSATRGLLVHRGSSDAVLSLSLTALRRMWEATCTQLELRQANPATVRQEEASFGEARQIPYRLTFTPELTLPQKKSPLVAILREEGTNGDREMSAAFLAAGFTPVDVSMSDILSGRVDSLDQFQGIAFPGGFSFADVFGSARGWAAPILFLPKVRALFDRFYDREDTFSLGVCNGCQLMANIGWLPERGLPRASQPRFLHNTSGRFESRWSAVKVRESPAIMLQGMAGSVLGIHVAHGEGKLVIPDVALAERIRNENLAPLEYVGPDGEPTEAYPYNPNGSPDGMTALCSPDGRHLAMMPHPERAFLPWQCHWMPREWRKSLDVAPWLRMFQNAHAWCLEHS